MEEGHNWESLNNYMVRTAPSTVYYIPNFLTIDEENHVMKQIYNAPKPKWTYLMNRRLQDYGGIPHKNGMIPESIPSWLQEYMDRISNLNIFCDENNGIIRRANHCLINEYKSGQGIMAHFDGPIFTPVISTISCGSHTILEFFQENDGMRNLMCKLLLEPRSLIVLAHDMYTKYLHSIESNDVDILDEYVVNLEHTKYKFNDAIKRDTRLSLTIRNVPKVINCNIFNLNKK